jgi:hypothetical protein
MSNSRIEQIKRELLEESGRRYLPEVLHGLAIRRYIQEVVYRDEFEWIS